MSNFGFPIIEVLATGEVASGNAHFTKKVDGTIQVQTLSGAQDLATSATVASAVAARLKKVQLNGTGATAITSTAHKDAEVHINTGITSVTMAVAAWTPTAPDILITELYNDTAIPMPVTIAGFNGGLSLDGDASNDIGGSGTLLTIPVNASVQIYVDADSFVRSKMVSEVTQAEMNAHTGNTTNPHGVTKSQVSLANADNTSDANKPVSSATQTALNAKQATLVSGTNVKTVNGVSIVGSGDVPAVVTVTNTVLPSLSAGATITADTTLADFGGVHYAVDATAGNIAIILPTAVGNSGEFVEFLRIDGSVNTVTVFTSTPTQAFSGIQQNAIGIGLKSLGGLTVSSDGTNPVVRSWRLPLNVSRLWSPSDAIAGTPVLWHDILDTAELVVSGAAITGLGNKGSLGVGYDMLQATPTAQPTLVGTSGIAGSYAQFDGGDVLASTAQNMFASTILTIAGLYQQPSASNATLFGQDTASGVRMQLHAKWSDNNTYVDLGSATTARMSANLGVVAGGSAVNHTAVAMRNAANMAAYFDGNPTASLTSASASGTPAGTASFRWGGDASGNPLPVNSRIYETVCYAVALSTADMDRLAGYLGWRHGSQAIINTGNAYRNAPPVVAIATY